jgi:hypothetical protein
LLKCRHKIAGWESLEKFNRSVEITEDGFYSKNSSALLNFNNLGEFTLLKFNRNKKNALNVVFATFLVAYECNSKMSS